MNDMDYLFDFEEFSRRFLKVKDKAGGVVPFIMNDAQRYIHSRLEEQKRETGRVRAVILKGRQQGCSTYTEGRFFHRTVTNFGVQAFILTHEQQATDNLFGMTQRYLENYPSTLKPRLGASNAKELAFPGLDSSFRVATAGNKGAGRSSTAQLFHGSEVAYWPSAEDHQAGIMQTVPLADDTEIIYESTANGIGNVFHTLWKSGVKKQGGWIAIFVPWFWQPEYRLACTAPLSEEDLEYGQLFDLDEHQLNWRRYKIGELGDVKLFKREYPSSPAEAFSVSDEYSLISNDKVVEARKGAAQAQGAVILGVDPARFGDDSTELYIRKGRVAEHVDSVHGKDTMEVAGVVLNAMKKYNPNAVFIDAGGLGAGVVDRLHELEHRSVHGVNFGGKAIDQVKYYNKRSEMWDLMKEWLEFPPVQIPDSDTLEMDLCGLRYSYDSKGRLKLESKDEAKKRGVSSPDEGDALALTWAMPVGVDNAIPAVKPWRPTVSGMGG